MVDAAGTSSYSYDSFGELTSKTDGAGKTLSYAYDELGRTTDVTYPLGSPGWASSQTVHDSYDAAGNLVSVTDFDNNTIALSYTADNLPSEMSLGPSGESVVSTYDNTDSPSSIELSGGSGVALGFLYSYTPAGNLWEERVTPSQSYSPASYDYSAQSRVTADTAGSNPALSYSQDASGNLTTLPTQSSATYDDASELTSSTLSGTTTDYTYNADGERTSETQNSTTTASASYNGAKELTSYSNPSADMTSASYDGTGLRSSDTVASTSQGFVWDTRPSVPQLLMDGTNAYLYTTGNAPTEQVDLSSGAVSYLVTDALGSVRGVLASSGALLASTAYDAWGNPETSGGLTSYTPFGFAGGYTDPTGLLYLVHRYYDPTTGAFASVDPLYSQTLTQYEYSSDNPVNEVDPSGEANPYAYLVGVVTYLSSHPAVVAYATQNYVSIAATINTSAAPRSGPPKSPGKAVQSTAVDPTGIRVPTAIYKVAQHLTGPALEQLLIRYDHLNKWEVLLIGTIEDTTWTPDLPNSTGSSAFGLGQLETPERNDIVRGIDVVNGSQGPVPLLNGHAVNPNTTDPFLQIWMMRVYIGDNGWTSQQAYNIDKQDGGY